MVKAGKLLVGETKYEISGYAIRLCCFGFFNDFHIKKQRKHIRDDI